MALCAALSVVILLCLAALEAPHLIPFFAGFAALLACVVALYVKRTGRDQKIRLWLFPIFEKFPLTRNGKGIILGRLDGCVEGELYGWALNPKDPVAAPKITVYVGKRAVADIRPVQYRPDIGRHCFYFDLSYCCAPNERATIGVRLAGGRLLPNSPLVVSIPANSAHPTETVLFMHIAKTAGTAFREAIVENYRQSEIAYLYPDPPGLLTYKLDLLPLEQRKGFRLVIGHFQYGMHDLLPQKCEYVTIVREPVARVISHYRYILEKQDGSMAIKQGSATGLAEMLERRATVNLDNLMVRCFAGVDEKDVPPGEVDKEIYSLAVHHLETNFCFVGYQEQANEAYRTLQQKFNWKPRTTLGNVNKSRFSGKQNYESARAAIEHFNRWDCQLYTHIRQLFP